MCPVAKLIRSLRSRMRSRSLSTPWRLLAKHVSEIDINRRKSKDFAMPAKDAQWTFNSLWPGVSWVLSRVSLGTISRLLPGYTNTHTHTNKRMKLIYSSVAGGGGSFLIQHPTLHRALLSRYILWVLESQGIPPLRPDTVIECNSDRSVVSP